MFYNFDIQGEIYWKGAPKEAPFLPPAFESETNNTRMLYLWVSDYMANSLGYSGFNHGFLVRNITAKDVRTGSFLGDCGITMGGGGGLGGHGLPIHTIGPPHLTFDCAQ